MGKIYKKFGSMLLRCMLASCLSKLNSVHVEGECRHATFGAMTIEVITCFSAPLEGGEFPI